MTLLLVVVMVEAYGYGWAGSVVTLLLVVVIVEACGV